MSLNQVIIVQPVGGNKKDRKTKTKAKMRYNGKKQPSSITTLKIITK